MKARLFLGKMREFMFNAMARRTEDAIRANPTYYDLFRVVGYFEFFTTNLWDSSA
jgi:hypothetical protein